MAFTGIGLVDPILPSIAEGLDATPSQVSLLFTSYFLITAVAMLVMGFVSSRIGGRRTLLAGLALVVVFAALSGTSSSVAELVGFRAGWGLGNALFVSTALAVIVGAAAGGSAAAILLYESALGLGMACGPLAGVVVAPRLQRRFGSLRVVGSLVLLAADLVVLGYGDHTTAVVCTIVSGSFIGMNNTVYTELALGVSDAPRPVASARYNFVRSPVPDPRAYLPAARAGRPAPVGQSSGTDARSGSRRSVPCESQRSWSSCAPLTRFHAASLCVIGSSGRKRTGSIGASSSRSSTRPPGSATRTELKGAPAHSGCPRSSDAPGATINPSTCGDAASTARGRNTWSVSARPTRTDRTSSARGPFTGSARGEVGSAIGWADIPSVA